MMRIVWAALALMAGACVARADVPVDDAANLDQKSLAQGATVKLVPVTQGRSSSTNCIKKSATTGQAAQGAGGTVGSPAAHRPGVAHQPVPPCPAGLFT